MHGKRIDSVIIRLDYPVYETVFDPQDDRQFGSPVQLEMPNLRIIDLSERIKTHPRWSATVHF